MFERYLTDVLTTHFGHLIDGFDKDRIRLSAWNGELVLNDLALRRDALDHWITDCPIHICYGRIGNLEIRIPWKLIRSRLRWRTRESSLNDDLKCTIVLSDVQILVTPGKEARTDDLDDNGSEEVKEASPEEKQRKLEEAVQAALKKLLLKRAASSSLPAAKESFLAIWIHERVAEILSNLIVRVRNVHVRYEDPGDCLGFARNLGPNNPPFRYRPSFSVGVLLRDFMVHSASKDPSSSTRDRIVAFKDLAAYWDSSCILASDLKTRTTRGIMASPDLFYREAFRLLDEGALPASFMSDSERSTFQSRHTYLLDPFSPSIEIALSSATTMSEPVSGLSVDAYPPRCSTIDVYFPQCQIILSRSLLEDLGYLRKSLAVWNEFNQSLLTKKTLAKLNKLRPTQSPLISPQHWWHYALQVVVAFESQGKDQRTSAIMRKRRRGWLGVAQILGKRKMYGNLYQNMFLEEDEEVQLGCHLELTRLEAELTVAEIVAFRIHTYEALRGTSDKVLKRSGDMSKFVRNFKTSSLAEDMLSFQHRKSTFIEMAEFLDREDSSKQIPSSASRELKPVCTTSMKCAEFGLRIDDHRYRCRKRQPVVRLSFALLQKLEVFHDGSWSMSNMVGDLIVKDCMVITSSDQRKPLPYLVSSRTNFDDAEHGHGFEINNKLFKETVAVRVQRAFPKEQSMSFTSKTSVVVRVHPLEIVYATKPLEALTRIFQTADGDFKDDYQHTLVRLRKWKNEKQKRLYQAMAHKEHNFSVDLDLAGPSILFSESAADGSLMVVIDLGRLKLTTIMEACNPSDSEEVDHSWKLDLSQLQVLRCSVKKYRDLSGLTLTTREDRVRRSMESIIEPFGVSFKIENMTNQGRLDRTQIRIFAELPRLAFNLTTSTIGLFRSLCHQWHDRRQEMGPTRGAGSSIKTVNPAGSLHSKSSFTYCKVTFDFEIPLFQLYAEIDTGKSGGKAEASSSPLFDLSLTGIEVSFVSEILSTGTFLTSNMSLHRLTMRDLYQQAGNDFSLMIASVDPTLLQADRSELTHSGQSPDLVSVQYGSVLTNSGQGSSEMSNYLTVNFHELFIGWNPESIGTIHKAMHSSHEYFEGARSDVDSSFYFDADEDDFFDAESVVSDSSVDTFMVSEISESVVSSSIDLKNDDDMRSNQFRSLPFLGSPRGLLLAPWSKKAAKVALLSEVDVSRNVDASHSQDSIPILVTFEMKRLKINFNKEVRHRRVFAVEMEYCRVNYQRKRKGGYKIKAVLEHFSLTDPGSFDNKTLYRELIGLKTDASKSKSTSLIELNFTKNPRIRKYLSTSDNYSASVEDCVSVDIPNGKLYGYDSKIEANLSPMKFVYLQQLWLEIIDYFFEGIVGYEVWGGTRPQPIDPSQLEEEATDAIEKFGVNALAIFVESPTILIPVSYCSTDFIRLESDELRIRNHFECGPMRTSRIHHVARGPLMQWYNNMSISSRNLRLSNANGSIICGEDKAPDGLVQISWPAGRTASMNFPKWCVKCSFDSLELALRKEDFALFRHIISSNIGEESRNMEEWVALQSLTPSALESYFASLLVTFGYDQKDLSPSTFDATLTVPQVKCFARNDYSDECSLYILSGLDWKFTKNADRISKQLLHCSLQVAVETRSGPRKLLNGTNHCWSKISYSSITTKSADTSRTMIIENPLVHADIPAFRLLSNFFMFLPEPTILSPNEVIQIGDRWYKLGGRPPQQDEIHVESRRASWLPMQAESGCFSCTSNVPVSATHTFALTVKESQVLLGDDEAAAKILIHRIDFTHASQAGSVRRKYVVDKVQMLLARNSSFQMTSLIDPWSLIATSNRCDRQKQCSCPMHSDKVSIGKLTTRISFSEMLIGIDVVLRIKRDWNAYMNSTTTRAEGLEASGENKETLCGRPSVKRFLLVSEGTSVVIVDDSGRHFSGSQELIEVSSGVIDFRTEERTERDGVSQDDSTSVSCIENSLHLRVRQLDVFDCLQGSRSPFRHVLGLRPSSVVKTCKNKQAPELDNTQVGKNSMPCHDLALEVLSLANAAHVYSIILGCVDIQYNPSMVIAVQRFLGRFLKRFKEKIIEEGDINIGIGRVTVTTQQGGDAAKTSRGTFECHRLSVCLNKEHQKRRLVRSTLSSCYLDVLNDKDGSLIQGHVKDLQSFVLDGCMIGAPERKFINTCHNERNFFNVLYRTYKVGSAGGDNITAPDWLQHHLVSNGVRIDDFIDISMSSLNVRVVRNHIEELVDYLSNGMPGKGMGATSRAAKGFVKKRIEKRSYFHLDMESPTFSLPSDELTAEGIELKLGDVLLESWISDVGQEDGKRLLKTSIQGLECTTMVAGSTILKKVDLAILAERSFWNLSLNAEISDVQFLLSYHDYIVLLNVFHYNLMRSVENKDWDNLETQWEKEQAQNSDSVKEKSDFPSPVSYASSARHVQFGGSKRVKSTSFNFRLSLGRLLITLSRATATHQPQIDFLFFHGRGLQLTAGKSSDGEMSCNLSLHQIYLFDLGERWVEARDQRLRKASVVIENYSPPEKGNDVDNHSTHFSLKVDRTLSGETKVAVVLSDLSVVVLQSFVQDTAKFLMCLWPCPDGCQLNRRGQNARSKEVKNRSPSGLMQVRFVLHYPRFIFVADESDPRSKALVLRGLAIANGAFRTSVPDGDDASGTSGSVTRINADLQNISSYIHADVSDILTPRSHHLRIIGDTSYADTDFESPVYTTEDFCIPLLLPLTVGMEFEHFRSPRYGVKRALSVNVDPLSIVIGSDDLSLVRSVVHKWSRSSSNETRTEELVDKYDVVFETERLGLGLRKEGGLVIVDSVKPATESKGVCVGDVIHRINGKPTDLYNDGDFLSFVNQISILERPITLSLARRKAVSEEIVPVFDTVVDRNSTFDVNFSSAVLSLVERDFPLLKAEVSSSRLACKVDEKEEKCIRLSISAFIGVDYYNFRIWCWEPLFEQGRMLFSADFQDDRENTRQLTLEFSDSDDGLAINITSAAAEAISKFLSWGTYALNFTQSVESEEEDQDEALNTENEGNQVRNVRSAATAALVYARKQKHGSTRPFIFRNRTGLSAAFVRHGQSVKTESHGLSEAPFLSVGEFSGLEKYDPSAIHVVGNGQDMLFRVETNNDVQDEDYSPIAKIPIECVSLQTVAGIVIEPLTGQEIEGPVELLLPIRFHKTSDQNSSSSRCPTEGNQMLSWCVELVEEKTIITLGSSIRIFSLLREPVEVALSFSVSDRHHTDEVDMKAVGMVYPNSYFYLPVWLDMTSVAWVCGIRTSEDYSFTTLVRSSAKDGLNFISKKTIECLRKGSVSPPNWLSVATAKRDGILTLTLDSSVSLRNLLPVFIDWEVSDPERAAFDGSIARALDRREELVPLESGEKVEIFARSTEGITARFRPSGFAHWSEHVSISLDEQEAFDSVQRPAIEGTSDNIERQSVRYVHLRDSFGVPHDLSVRIMKKDCGLEIVLFAELWLTNCTSLDIAFGYPWEATSSSDNEARQDFVEDELSAAEAALREISSLFDGGVETKRLRSSSSLVADITRIAGQTVPCVVEEFFEYVDLTNEGENRWWATENPNNKVHDPREIDPCIDAAKWFWKDKDWQIDYAGSLSDDGFESFPNLNNFVGTRTFNVTHRFRRRRWFRKRSGFRNTEMHVPGVHGYYQPRRDVSDSNTKERKSSFTNAKIGIQVNGGRWAITSDIPNFSGRIYGAIRARASRWPEQPLLETKVQPVSYSTSVFELCYAIFPLEGPWGELSRSLTITSRFLLINHSKTISFEVKQMGSSDTSSVEIPPGDALPFHWADFRRPELLSVRPLALIGSEHRYEWSGGFDPLTIGALPIRIQQRKAFHLLDSKHIEVATSVKMDAEIRRGTGGTGINISFEEEENSGDGALFRIENYSTFPVWIAQDGVLANPSGDTGDLSSLEGTMVSPSSTSCFALDVPFRQGKYTGRKAATIAELLRVRLGLSPLNTRSGIETTKVLCLSSIGTRVRLNPTKLLFLETRHRSDLDRVRILGVVTTDGPTTVLNLRMIEKDSDNFLVNPFSIDDSIFDTHLEQNKLSSISQLIAHAASETVIARRKVKLPTEMEVINKKLYRKISESTPNPKRTVEQNGDLQISLRVSLRGLVVSFVDSAPSEVAVLTLKNLNGIASWNTHRTTNAAVIITITDLQMDNMISNAPFPVAISPIRDDFSQGGTFLSEPRSADCDKQTPPVLVIGLSFAPKHKTGTVCLRSVTIAPRDLGVRVDLAFLIRLQKFALELESYFQKQSEILDSKWPVPDISKKVRGLEARAQRGMGLRKFFFSGFTILPHNIKLSVAPARALTGPQTAVEGKQNSEIHQAIRKGDVRLDRSRAAVLGVRVGRTNRTAVAVLRGVFKSIVVDALLRLDGATVNFGGVSLRNHIATGSQLSSQLGAHYLNSLRQNVPALLGSLAALGNPIGLARGLGDGVKDLILEPVKGFQRSVQEMDASYLVDGVARGTFSLARHTVGGFADSAAMLTETFSKNMAVLTLDRRYAQKRDRGEILRDHDDINVALGLGSGVQKLITGFLEGVTGVVKAPIRGAEKKGLEGFAKGIGKGLLGLLVKPIIGISDGIADVMLGVKGSLEGATGVQSQLTPLRPRRALYGRERSLRSYNMADAAASSLLMRTRLAGEEYFDHLDMGDRLLLVSVKRLLVLGSRGQELLLIRLKHIESVEVRSTKHGEDEVVWSVLILLSTPRSNGSDVEVIACRKGEDAKDLCSFLETALKRLRPIL